MRWWLASILTVLVGCGGPMPESDGGVDGGGIETDGGFDLNDVSWLEPLPNAALKSSLLAFDASGARGVLFPRPLYDALPVLVPDQTNALIFSEFRIIGVRVDPCFPKDAENSACIKQVRLVAQPVTFTPLASTRDATIHLFYDLSDDDWAQLISAVTELKAMANGATAGLPLDVHPVIRREGVNGAYATKLHSLVTRLCGAQNLSRVAFMRLLQEDVAWRFGAFNVENGAFVADPIPRLNALTEQGVQEFGNTEFRSGDLQPGAPGDDLGVLLSEQEMRLTDERTLQKAITSALKLEHPQRSSPKTADCGSCHVASRALTNAKNQKQLDLSQHADAFVFDTRFNLRRIDRVGNDPRALRAFGYFKDQSAFSQRVINESAEVAAALSRSP
ncbi:MAG: hypothetical protein ACO1OB_21470 [Archangium sp.]